MNLDLLIDTDFTPLPSKQQLQQWAQLIPGDHQQLECCVRIVDSIEIRQLNKDFRGKDYATNVLSFPFEYPPGFPEVEQNLLGDLAICPEVVWQEAEQQGKKYFDHWAHMLVHGLLHLLGYDHQTDDEAEEMETLEQQLLAKIHIANPYQDQGL